jgi:hypothetical protein
MNTKIDTENELDILFPDGKVVSIPRAGGVIEKITIMPMPAKKWKKAMQYIAKIAPLLGFNLQDDTLDTTTMPDALQQNLWQIISSDDADVFFEFIAYAIDKDEDFVGALYDEIIDIAIAVIEVNLVFFVHKLLPKIIVSMPKVAAIAQNAQSMAKTLTHGQ